MAFVFTLLEPWAPPTNHLSSQHALGSASSVHSRSNKLVSFLLTQFLSSPFLQRAPSVHVENTPKHFRKVFTCKIEGLDNTLKKGGNKKRCIWTKRNTALGSEWRGWGGRWLISFVIYYFIWTSWGIGSSRTLEHFWRRLKLWRALINALQ